MASGVDDDPAQRHQPLIPDQVHLQAGRAAHRLPGLEEVFGALDAAAVDVDDDGAAGV